MSNIILNTDSYKYSMFNQYPPGTEYVYSYVESRGGAWDSTVFFGLQAFIKSTLMKPITLEDILEAEMIVTGHGEPFYKEGWLHILKEHNGYLPVKIDAVPEGTVVPVNNVLATIVNTDPKCLWLTTFLETALLRAIWYPTTVATNSFESKKIIHSALKRTGDLAGLPFKLHDFGARGVSSEESASIGGLAHLVNFMGTDTISALVAARRYYQSDIAGFSIPAMEHSTVTSWTKEGEVDAFRNMIKNHAKPGGLFACVSDSYDIFAACHKWGTELKDDVISSGATLVVRPDSGNPSEVVTRCLLILEKYFGSTMNDKGYRTLNNVRVIQGDGINHGSIRQILYTMELAGLSADNVAFGQGGALLQQINRDTMKFAMKCSSIGIRDEKGNLVWRDVFKDPITDPGKKSKAGRVTLFYDEGMGGWYSGVEDWKEPALKTVYENGRQMNVTTLEEVRQRANQPFTE